MLNISSLTYVQFASEMNANLFQHNFQKNETSEIFFRFPPLATNYYIHLKPTGLIMVKMISSMVFFYW